MLPPELHDNCPTQCLQRGCFCSFSASGVKFDSMLVASGGVVKSGAVPKTVSSGQLCLWAWMHADSSAWAQMTGRRRYKVGL